MSARRAKAKPLHGHRRLRPGEIVPDSRVDEFFIPDAPPPGAEQPDKTELEALELFRAAGRVVLVDGVRVGVVTGVSKDGDLLRPHTFEPLELTRDEYEDFRARRKL